MKRRRKNKIRNLIKFANFYELTRVTSIINPVSGVHQKIVYTEKTKTKDRRIMKSMKRVEEKIKT